MQPAQRASQAPASLIAEVIGQGCQQAAATRRAQRLDGRQIVGLGLGQLGIVRQRVQLSDLLREQRFDFGHFIRHALRAEFDLLRGVAVDQQIPAFYGFRIIK